jgi:hypothetical protein
MLRFEKSGDYWWRKPLARVSGRSLPAELVVLQKSLLSGEEGAWLNSRGTRSGVVDLQRDAGGKFKSVRINLPDFVSAILESLYQRAGVVKGAPDLVIWNVVARRLRFIEVKCPHWDRLSPEQVSFFEAAKSLGIATAIEEWEFY